MILSNIYIIADKPFLVNSLHKHVSYIKLIREKLKKFLISLLLIVLLQTKFLIYYLYSPYHPFSFSFLINSYGFPHI